MAKDRLIPISFRAWELYEYPLLPATSKHVWIMKTSTQLEKPRYIFVGFHTARKNNANKNASHFDHCNIQDVKLVGYIQRCAKRYRSRPSSSESCARITCASNLRTDELPNSRISSIQHTCLCVRAK